MEQNRFETAQEYRDDMILRVGDSDFYDNTKLKFVIPPIHKMEYELANLKKLGLEDTYLEFYKLNSSGLRSNDFTTDHDGKHVLFAGCSNTYGQGVPEEYTWTRKLYMKMIEQEKLSGYYNVGFIAATNIEIVMQVMLYIEKYGKPDYIFLGLPDTYREFGKMFRSDFFDEAEEKFGVKDYVGMEKYINTDHLNLISIFVYNQFYRYCQENNIKLFSFCWAGKAKDDQLAQKLYDIEPRNQFMGLHEFEWNDLYEHAYEYQNNNKDSVYKDFMLTALDDEHYGIAVHDFWYNFMYKKYLEDTLGEKNG
jgi:hypothetical protein